MMPSTITTHNTNTTHTTVNTQHKYRSHHSKQTHSTNTARITSITHNANTAHTTVNKQYKHRSHHNHHTQNKHRSHHNQHTTQTPLTSKSTNTQHKHRTHHNHHTTCHKHRSHHNHHIHTTHSRTTITTHATNTIGITVSTHVINTTRTTLTTHVTNTTHTTITTPAYCGSFGGVGGSGGSPVLLYHLREPLIPEPLASTRRIKLVNGTDPSDPSRVTVQGDPSRVIVQGDPHGSGFTTITVDKCTKITQFSRHLAGTINLPAQSRVYQLCFASCIYDKPPLRESVGRRNNTAGTDSFRRGPRRSATPAGTAVLSGERNSA